jgi:alpha-tubulin suppressor-like RCC1 family protein
LLSVVALAAMTCLTPVGAISADGATMHGSTNGVTGSTTSARAYRWGAWINNHNRVVGRAIDAPQAIAGITGTIVQLTASNATSYVLTSDGTVWAWGLGSVGELGNGGTSPSYKTAMKVDFPADVTITQLATPMPFDSGLARDSTGHVWAWGLDANSSMCLKSEDILKPTEVSGLSNVTALTGQGDHSSFDAGGTVVSCGDNNFGQLGDGTTTSSATPVSVIGLPDDAVVSLESSWCGTGALLANGTYYDWGFNVHGQMGIGNTKKTIKTAEMVPLPAKAVQVFQGGSISVNGQSVALLSDGTVWAWGNGHAGQLGDGGTSYSDTPVQVSVPSGVSFVQVNSGGATSYAVDSTGRIWSWGSDKDGSLGNGSSTGDALTPTRIAGGPFTFVTSTAINVAAY